MLKVAVVAVAILVVLVLIVVAVGYALPVAHVASRQASLPQTPDEVFATLSERAAPARAPAAGDTWSAVGPTSTAATARSHSLS